MAANLDRPLVAICRCGRFAATPETACRRCRKRWAGDMPEAPPQTRGTVPAAPQTNREKGAA